MESDFTHLEAELAKLKPAPLPDDFLSRLDEAMVSAAAEQGLPEGEVIISSCDPELVELEEGLRGLTPYGMPDDFIARLDEAMQKWHIEVPLEEKVVMMRPDLPTKGNWLGLRSVAAVGILGAAMALVANDLRKPDTVAQSDRIPVLTNGAVSQASFVSRDARSSVVAANDHGVIWTKSGRAVRCLEVEVNNSLEFVNENGDRLTIEKPKHEVRFVPVKFD